MDEFLSFIVYVLQPPVHLAKFHILISTVHAKSACVDLLYGTNLKSVLLFSQEIIAKQCAIHITHLRGQNQRLKITVLPESFLFLIFAILTLMGMDK